MSPLCEGHQSYIGTAEFQSFAFHILTAIEIPIHVFAAYVILFKTPSRMKSVKWAMFNLHVWTACLDLSLSFLTIPYIFLTSTAGFGLGFLTFLGVNPAYQTVVGVAGIGFTIASIIVLFESQHFLVTRCTTTRSHIRRFIAVSYFFSATCFLPFVCMVPDQNSAVDELLRDLPTLRCFYSGPVFVMTRNATPLAVVTILTLLIELAVIGFLVTSTLVFILRQSKSSTRSRATLALQKRFFIGLMIQVTIPFCVIFLPLAFCAYALLRNYFNQAMNNISFLIISCHGLISTIAMLMVHQPYRRATFFCLKRKTSAVLRINMLST